MVSPKEIPVRILVLDILKPHKPDNVEFSQAVCADTSIQSVNINVYAVDEKTETIKMTVDGKDINFKRVKKLIEDFGAVIHSVDKVVSGRREIIPTPEFHAKE